MFINKSTDNRNNVCGKQVELCRKKMGYSQRHLADMLQLAGLDIDKNAIQRIEAGKRFVTDIELIYLSNVLHLSYNQLLNNSTENHTNDI